jgi:C-terminal processing protease CtpA/Prc
LLLKEIKFFIPTNQQDLYENLNKNKIYESINDLPKSSPFIAELATEKQAINTAVYMPKKPIPTGIRRLVLVREKNEKFGLTLQGSQPVVIDSVDANSPGDLSGLHANDVILSINDMDVSDKNHKFLVELLKSSGLNPIFEVV